MHTPLATIFALRPAARHAGFTLVELMVVLAIGGVLTATALPSMSTMLHSQRSTSLANGFVSSLNLARVEAIKRNARAVVCKSATGESCSTTGGWEQGWIVFHDANNNAQLDEGEQIVQQQGRLVAGPRLTGNRNVASYVSYSAVGSSKLTSGAFQSGTFTLCPASASSAVVRQIVLSPAGRPRVVNGTQADCP